MSVSVDGYLILPLGKSMNLRLVPLALLAVLATGCLAIPYPHKVTKFPGVSGILVTRTTGEPIPGVTVKVTRRYELVGNQNPTQAQIDASIIDERLTVTSAIGQFRVEPEESLHFFKFLPLVPFDPFRMPTLLDISYQLAPGQAFHEASYPPCLGFYMDHPGCIVGMASKYGPFYLGAVSADSPPASADTPSPLAGQAVTTGRVPMLMLPMPKRHQGTTRAPSCGGAPGLGRGARRATERHAYA